jgi:hypothetical protein
MPCATLDGRRPESAENAINPAINAAAINSATCDFLAACHLISDATAQQIDIHRRPRARHAPYPEH